MRLLEEGSARGRLLEDVCRICPILGAAAGNDEPVARERAAWWVSFYLTTMGPLYGRTLELLGYGSEVSAVLAANPNRQAGMVPPEAEVLLEELIVFGTPGAARERLTRWYTAGASFPILSFPRIGHGKRSRSPFMLSHQEARNDNPSSRTRQIDGSGSPLGGPDDQGDRSPPQHECPITSRR